MSDANDANNYKFNGFEFAQLMFIDFARSFRLCLHNFYASIIKCLYLVSYNLSSSNSVSSLLLEMPVNHLGQCYLENLRYSTRKDFETRIADFLLLSSRQIQIVFSTNPQLFR